MNYPIDDPQSLEGMAHCACCGELFPIEDRQGDWCKPCVRDARQERAEDYDARMAAEEPEDEPEGDVQYWTEWGETFNRD